MLWRKKKNVMKFSWFNAKKLPSAVECKLDK